MVKHKAYAVLLMSFLIVIISSCARREPTILNDDAQKAEARLEQVIEAIKSQDKEALKAMFSKQALDEAQDLNERMDYLFSFIEGDIQTWEDKGGIDDGVNNYGHTVMKSKYWYIVSTDKEDYLFFLFEYTKNTDHPENEGLYMVQVIKAEDMDAQFDVGTKTLCAGIYKPEE